MPLNEENFENFYRGNSAEHIVSSQIFFHGFEAHKYNPDFGVDLLVTNKARQKYLSEESIEFNIQVKSSLVVKNRASISINKEEFAHLMQQNNPVLTSVLFDPEFIGQPSLYNNLNSYAQTLHSMDEWLDNAWAEQNYHSQFNVPRSRNKCEYLKNKKAANNLALDGYESTLFWLNKNQLRKALELGVLQQGLGKGKDNYYLNLAKDDEGTWYFQSTDDSSYYPYIEISHLSYLFLKQHNYGIEMEDFSHSF
ncbi:hypothetical protein CWC25_20155 [Pseudoalteromonas sp. S4389]|uniref:hypothetical protein n=1 Tax=Pseudoalteromonas sp. S4389 TaxID=579556 RepID=UPI00110963FB|nr:hypothetical protein [Pseudoalteromonas sp. S4389]TMO40564.1 hypothetical protein CWC25_20155 [Pseudoalteromonas sp. S4389]